MPGTANGNTGSEIQEAIVIYVPNFDPAPV